MVFKSHSSRSKCTLSSLKLSRNMWTPSISLRPWALPSSWTSNTSILLQNCSLRPRIKVYILWLVYFILMLHIYVFFIDVLSFVFICSWIHYPFTCLILIWVLGPLQSSLDNLNSYFKLSLNSHFCLFLNNPLCVWIFTSIRIHTHL